jgi:hypothetical protein
VRFFSYKSGTRGVEFKLKGGTGGSTKMGFPLSEAARFKLRLFAKACGVTKEQAALCDPDGESGFDVFIGKPVEAIVALNGKYNEMVGFAGNGIEWIEQDAPAPVQPAAASSDNSPAAKADLPF